MLSPDERQRVEDTAMYQALARAKHAVELEYMPTLAPCGAHRICARRVGGGFMTARELADRFVGNDLEYFGGPVTPKRIRKLMVACERHQVAPADVLALLPADVAEQVRA